MPFVDVPHRGLELQRFECAHAPNAEHNLLLDARAAISTVELMGDVAGVLVVLGQIGVQQVETDVPAARVPDFAADRTSWQVDPHVQLAAVLTQHRRDRKALEVGIGVLGVLGALRVDGLGEIALTIEQTHADERQAHVAGRLAVIASEYPQAAGVDREALVEAEFCAEVRYEIRGAQPFGTVTAQRFVVVRIVVREYAIEVAEEYRIVGRFEQPLLVDSLEKGFGIVSDRIP